MVLKTFTDKERGAVLYKICRYMVEENFQLEHLNAIHAIITRINTDKDTESQFFDFVISLKTKIWQMSPAELKILSRVDPAPGGICNRVMVALRRTWRRWTRRNKTRG